MNNPRTTTPRGYAQSFFFHNKVIRIILIPPMTSNMPLMAFKSSAISKLICKELSVLFG
jgi:hypothetical protein